MGDFNRRSYEAGKSGGHSPISSTPGQPASMKDREAYWQGKAQAQWTKPTSPISNSSASQPFSGGGYSRGGGGGASTAGKGAGALVVLVIVIAFFASLGGRDKKAEAPAADQPQQSQTETPQPPAEWNIPAKPSSTKEAQPLESHSDGVDPVATPPQTAQNVANPAPEAMQPTAERSAEPAAIMAAPPFPARTYAAKHKEGLGGGCDGLLTLSATGMLFDCSNEHYNFPIGSIAGPHKDGLILKTGEKYHFHLSDVPKKEDAESVFFTWYWSAERASENPATTEGQQ